MEAFVQDVKNFSQSLDQIGWDEYLEYSLKHVMVGSVDRVLNLIKQ
jgi:hypothetical protein